MAKPTPVSKVTVCSVCDLPWDDHTKGRKTAPTADVCIRLLKAKLASRPTYPYNMSGTQSATATNFNVVPIQSAVG